jgi:hypothetical protein
VIRENKVPAIFIESTINPKLLEQLAKDNHVKIGGQLYADSIGEKDSPASSYLDMLKYNTDVIVKALNVEMMEEKIEEVAESSGMKTLIFMGLLLIPLMAFLVYKMR